MKTVTIYYFLIFFSFTAKAKSLKWLDIEQKSVYRIDIKKNILEKETKPNEWQEIGNISLKNIQEKDILEGNLIRCLHSDDKNSIYLLINCTNQVYQFNYKTLLLERIDETYYGGFNCKSTIFIRNKTIYSFGGYGLFRTNNLLVYFQKEKKEWDATNFLNDAPKSGYKGLSGYVKKTDSFFTGLNFCLSDSENSGKITTDYGFYEYKFKDNKWYKLGEIKQPVLKKFEQKDGRHVHWNGKYFIIRVFEQPFNKLIIIDPFLNEVFQWIDNKGLFDVEIPIESEKEYVHKDSLFSHKLFNIGNRNSTIQVVVSIEAIKKQATYVGKLYELENNNFWILLISTGVGLVIVFLVIYYIFFKDKSRNKNVFLSSNNLDNVEIEMVEVLIENHEKGGITTEQINDFLNINDKSIENQRKIRHEFIKSLNLKLKMIFSFDNSIERKPSTIDKRIFNYQLNYEIIKEFKSLYKK